METTLATKFVGLAYNKMDYWKELKQLLLHVPNHNSCDPSLKEKFWFLCSSKLTKINFKNKNKALKLKWISIYIYIMVEI
jgi:hypothetical protein